jgi:Fe-only nitrogenase accessory protein AnfO
MASKTRAPQKIAAFIDADGNLADPCGSGQFRIYDRSSGDWLPDKDIAFTLSGTQGLRQLQIRVFTLAEAMGDCKILLVGAEAKGIFPTLLGEQAVTVALASGSALKCLASVPLQETVEKELPEVEAAAPVSATEVGPGAYRIDLALALKDRPELNSKQVLFPLLAKAGLESLEVLCDHLPRWLDSEGRALGYIYVVKTCDESIHGFSVMLYRSGDNRGCGTSGVCAQGCGSRCGTQMTEL